MADRPTQSAQNWFRISKGQFQEAMGAAGNAGASAEWKIAMGNIAMMDGLIDLSTGSSTTYQLFEEVRQMLQRQR